MLVLLIIITGGDLQSRLAMSSQDMNQGRHAGVPRLVLPNSVLGQPPHVTVLRISEAVDQSGEIILEISFFSSLLLDLPGKTSEAKLHPAHLLAQSEG